MGKFHKDTVDTENTADQLPVEAWSADQLLR